MHCAKPSTLSILLHVPHLITVHSILVWNRIYLIHGELSPCGLSWTNGFMARNFSASPRPTK